MALRVLSAIGVPMTGNVVAMGIKKCASDPSPYVRKAAALAIPKCYACVSISSIDLVRFISWHV
jgi:AP-3 complex subunit beta